MDKRQSRRVNNNSFAVAISEWKRTQLQQHPSPENRVEGDARFDGRMARQVSPAPRAPRPPGTNRILTPHLQPLACLAEEGGSEAQPVTAHPESGRKTPRRVRVLLRKRPLFAPEEARGEFDVVSVKGKDGVVIHNCRMEADLKRMFVKHMQFTVSKATLTPTPTLALTKTLSRPQIGE